MEMLDALKSAAEMLRHIAKGGSYDTIAYYERLHAIEAAVKRGEELVDELRRTV